MKKEIICTVCPRGCMITVEGEKDNITSVTGYVCNRGKEYATAEFSAPVRILTTTVKIDGAENDLLPVRSSAPIPKDKILECMDVIKKSSVKAPVEQYQVIVKDICNTGIDIVATKELN
ncbi:MAG: DUF1667 domain-containing protein [Clostridia bacterium]|nr:DUF1667 domain-containing protein [Clostridia bacterium]